MADHQSLHDMKINVSNIKPLVEIGLFEAETEFTQFVDQYFDTHFNEIHDEGMVELIKTSQHVIRRSIMIVPFEFQEFAFQD